MKVVVNEKALIEAMESLAAGTEEVEQEEPDGGWGNRDGEPIEASPVMSTQLAVDRPPVGDPDFMPTSTQQLSRSASTISEEVPQDQIDFFYRKLHDILDQALDRHGSSEYEDSETTEEPTEEEEEEESLEAAQEDIPDEEDAILESVFKKAISMILEQEDQDDDVIFAQTDEEVADINSATADLLTHFQEQEIGYEEEEYESILMNPGQKFRKPMRPEKMRLDLARALVVDDLAKQLLGGLTPEGRTEVIRRIHQKYKSDWQDLFASPEFIEQLEFNKEVDMEARKMMKDQTNEEVLAYLLAKAESETDPRRKEAYKTIATLTKQGAVVDTPTWDREMREIELTPEQQRLAGLEKAEKDLKKLDSLSTYFGFKNASGIRQWRRKFAEPKFKALIGSMTGVSAYGDYANKVMENMAALLDEFVSITERTLASLDADKNLSPEEEDLKEGISHINDQFQAMLTASHDDELGHIPTDLLQGGGGYILRIAFSEAYFNKQFRDFAKLMKDHIVAFLVSQGIDPKAANTFSKMFNGEVDLVTLDADSAQARKLVAGGITPEIYKAAAAEEQKFISNFFTGDYQKKSDQQFLQRLGDKKYLVKLFEKSIDEALSTMDIEKKLDQALEVPEKGDEDVNLEENLKKMINTILRM